MDKRVAYIVLGSLVILYLVAQKASPELVRDLQGKAVAVWNGKSARAAEAGVEADQWEKHRADVFASRVAESKRLAIAKYPSLAVADSEMNIRFVFRYQWMVKDNSPRLHAPNWPELLADDCAAAVHSDPKAATALKTAKPGVKSGVPTATAVASR